MLDQNGVPSKEQVLKEFPDKVVLKKPKAIIECYKGIPCNPCSTNCPFDAIFIPEDINKRPDIDFDKCTGCGVCVYNCPGLAITVRMLVDGKARLKIPYEFYPLPEKGKAVNVLNRGGEKITTGLITRVQMSDKQNKTAHITVDIDEEYYVDAMTIEVEYGS